MDKLNNMEDKKYYDTPIEDLFIGYECEIQTSWNYVKGIWPEILQQDTHINLFSKGPIRQQITTADLRTKYLDKEDIESCEWKLVNEEIKQYSHWCNFKSKDWELSVQLNDKYFPRLLNLSAQKHCSWYGNVKIKCKSINELRTLMKWLGIK